MKIRLLILFSIIMIASVTPAFGGDSSQARMLFHKGNAYYNDEGYEDAIVQYEEALRLGLESGPLYYNLANAYFKSGSLGKAILNYSRAKRLMPKDADLLSNLAYAQSLIKGGTVVSERKWLARVFFGLADSFSLDKITLLCSVLYLILSVLIILYILAKDLKKIASYLIVLVMIMLVVSIGLFYVQYNKIIVHKEAVVISDKSDSKFEPFDDATTFFTLYEGESVNIVTSEKDWVKIKRLDNKQGWIKKSDLEFI